jgi:hypothetical protein
VFIKFKVFKFVQICADLWLNQLIFDIEIDIDKVCHSVGIS